MSACSGVNLQNRSSVIGHINHQIISVTNLFLCPHSSSSSSSGLQYPIQCSQPCHFSPTTYLHSQILDLLYLSSPVSSNTFCLGFGSVSVKGVHSEPRSGDFMLLNIPMLNIRSYQALHRPPHYQQGSLDPVVCF